MYSNQMIRNAANANLHAQHVKMQQTSVWLATVLRTGGISGRVHAMQNAQLELPQTSQPNNALPVLRTVSSVDQESTKNKQIALSARQATCFRMALASQSAQSPASLQTELVQNVSTKLNSQRWDQSAQ